MKFFVTGVNGQLGHDVMNELAKRGYEGIGSDIQPAYGGVAAAMTYVSLDITDREAVFRILEEIRPDAVIQDVYKRQGLVKDLLHACRNEREQQLFSYRFGLEDGVPKTLQEAADQFGISIERARQIQSMAMRRIWGHIRRRKVLSDYLED